MKRIRQIRAIHQQGQFVTDERGNPLSEERVIEVPIEATVTGAEDLPADAPLYGWRPVTR